MKKNEMTKEKKKKVDKTKKVTVKKNSKKGGVIKEGVNGFFKGIANEMKNVHWLTKKNMIKYSVATIVFVLFFSVFFYFIELVFALIKTLV